MDALPQSRGARLNGKIWQIYQLQEGDYSEVEVSSTFSQVPKERLYWFLAQAREDEIEAVQSLRAWWNGFDFTQHLMLVSVK